MDFKGPDKEECIIYEILEDISFQFDVQLLSAQAILRKRLNENISLSIWKEKRLYANDSQGITYGYLIIPGFNINVLQSYRDIKRANLVLQEVKKVIDELGSHTKGIISILESKNIGDEFEINLSFSNNHLSIASMIKDLFFEKIKLKISIDFILQRALPSENFKNMY